MTEKEERAEAEEKRYDEGHIAGYELAETRKEIKLEMIRELLPLYEKNIENLEGMLGGAQGEPGAEDLAKVLKDAIRTLKQMRDETRDLLTSDT